MSFFAVYVYADGTFQDEDTLASGTGWLHWCEWVDTIAGRYPVASRLSLEGDASALDDLEHELEALLHEDADVNARTVTAGLLGAVKHRPAGTVALIVTDGTPGDESEDDS